MSDEKVISISIAAFNAEKWIGKAIESCIVEDIIELIEIIIVNDGSMDSTVDIAKKYEEKYKGSIIVIDKKNEGYGSTVNESLKIARGKYYKLLDSDDWYDPDVFKEFVHVLSSINVDYVVSDYVVTNNIREKVVSYSITPDDFIDFSTIVEPVGMHSSCFNTELLRRSGLKLNDRILYTDTEYSIWPLYDIDSGYYFKKKLYYHFVGNDEQSTSKISRIRHIKDTQIVNLAHLDKWDNSSGNITNNRVRRLILLDLAANFKFCEMSHFLCNTVESREDLIEFDEIVKGRCREAYELMTNKCIAIFRINRKLMYRLCAWYAIRKKDI